MTAVVEVHVARLEDVLSVPVQAIVQRGRQTWCYTQGSGGVERIPVELGRTNDKFVQIRSGLNDGDRVVLNPMSIFDDSTDSIFGQESPLEFEGDLAPGEQIAAQGEDSAAEPAAIQQVANQGDAVAGEESAQQSPGRPRRGSGGFGDREMTPEMRERMEAFRAERRQRAESGTAETGRGDGERSAQRRGRGGRRAEDGEQERPRRRTESDAQQQTEAVEAGGD